ncbi:MAG: glycosyltransferase family 4 protein [Candidatus Tectimicrobiota bacterium]
MQQPTLHPARSIQRVLMTADTVGGVWTYALELVRALRDAPIHVGLATMGAPLSPQQRAAVQGLDNVTLYESTLKLEWMAEPWADVEAAGAWLLDLEARFQPDVIHLNGYAHGALPWQAPTLMVGHSCVLSWFAAVHGREAAAEWQRYRQEVQRGLRAADLVTAPTTAMLTALHTHYGPFTAAPAIANGRRSQDFLPAAKAPYLFTAGRLWDAAKNVALLETVAPRLCWPIFVAGEPHHPAGGTARFTALQMLGPLAPTALAAWLGRAAIFVLPARYEPFGLSILEAGLAGCALVVGDLASLREVWGEAALFVPPDEPAALTDLLQGLLKHRGWREQMARRARARALGYTPERMARAYLALYHQLVRHRAATCAVLTPAARPETPGQQKADA